MPSRKPSTKSASASRESNTLNPYRHSAGEPPSAASSYTALPIPLSPLDPKPPLAQNYSDPPASDDGSRSSSDRKVSTEDAKDAPRDAISKLPTQYQGILRRQVETPDFRPTLKTLYRYATRNDLIIIAVSAVCALAAGAVLPVMTVIFGSLSGTFSNFFLGVITKDDFLHQLGHLTVNFVYLALGQFVAIYIFMVGFIYTGEHISGKIRENYLAAILRQNVGYFDKIGAGEITTRITGDTNLIQEGISEKSGLVLMSLSTFITAFIIAFAKYWLLALILTSSIFGIVLIMALGTSSVIKWNREALNAYAAGGTVAEEVLASIRNATAFGTQDKLAKQYASHLGRAEYWGFRRQALLGTMLGGTMFVVYLCYALAFWMGSRFLVRHQGGVGVSEILTVLMSIMIGAFNLGGIAPSLQAIGTGLAAAGKIFTTIERCSPLDPTSEEGRKLEHVAGDIELRNVTMIYPSRPEVTVMKRVNLSVKAGQTTALVGSSGSGKSTIVGLVERFYDPVAGDIFLDGINVKDLNLRFLRRQMALVSQEPTLFSTTIFGNIVHGLIGTPHEDASDEEKMRLVIKASKMANAHEFVSALPEGYDTNVGARGFLLSGGQKQRIAIARAVVSDPKILLLDEATSALDTKSERVVQEALDRAAEGRTTIVIAHRLSTIKNADNIIVMSEGCIIEQGTHSQLLERRAAYWSLVEAQKIAQQDGKNKEVGFSEEAEDSEEDEDELQLKKSESRYSQSRRSRLGLSGLSFNRHRSNKSVASIAMVEAQAKEEAEKNKKFKLWQLIKLTASFNKQEWPVLVIGLLASMVAGGAQPTQAVFFAKCIVALSKPPFLYDQLRHDIDYWCWFYFMLAWVILIAFGVQGTAFAYCSERLVHKSRDTSFRRMLRQDIAFYDRDENSAGALTTFLSTQTTSLAGLSGVTLGTILNVVTTLVSCFILSLAIGWKLALVCIACVPILLLCGFARLFLLARLQARSKKAYEGSASYACEATSAIRTVASLGREQDVWNAYHEKIAAQGKASIRSVAWSTVLYAASQSFMFLCVAVGFYYGGVLIANREFSIENFFIVFSAVIFGSQSAGTVFSFAPDMGKAKAAAVELKRLYDRQPPIDNWSNKGEAVPDTRGHVEFRDVHFRYPTRPEQPVLRGLNLTVRPGQYVALVGPSGCGKSTTISLLERFYDPQGGAVLLDGRNIASLKLQEYRSHLALVSQEPTLYQGTIRDNILLGADHLEGDADDDAIERACRDANIYNFILSLPEGFDTVVGNKGVMLSGGQKQRIAIARALLRNPRVLLLDEATSALDSESEKIVQAALDQAARGRTTVAVAHRLSTIQKADCIYVFDGGVVVERGTHAELMKQGGRYFELVKGQSLEKV